ncbi:MAG TPA: glycogen synthase GlgA [Gammaproteobacteria bacterium]|jgi:starch synthase|nr:glycogen synthase GlgA [Gammaproteobacteria bacterium]
MKILFASSEAHPLIKTGGLADVSGALPKALHDLKQDVRLILPAYQVLLPHAGQFTEIARLTLTGSVETVRVLEGRLPGTDVVVYLVDAPRCFDRPGNPYCGPDGTDWPDNAQRFATFCRAIVEVCQDRAGLGWRPDIVHCNDWQTGLVPALLSLESTRPASVFTVHNLAYQGLFDKSHFQTLGLPYMWWSMQALEFHGRLSFIKAGLVYADALTTVSPTYAEEIRTPEFGCGLDGLLTHRAAQLTGILNGADASVWNPASDPLLDTHFSRDRLKGKDANKQSLQTVFDLPTAARTPVFAHIGRLVEQKGIDMLLDILPELMQRPLQLVMLGSGHAHLETALRAAQARYPQQLGLRIGYDETLAHRIEAGADAFLMPSRFEPCGLNQIYSLRYGTLPIVRRTGGLADTVVDTTPATLDAGTATGFVFDSASPEALLACIDRALRLYALRTVWTRVVKNAMAEDFSWTRSAQQYLDLYQSLTPST